MSVTELGSAVASTSRGGAAARGEKALRAMALFFGWMTWLGAALAGEPYKPSPEVETQQLSILRSEAPPGEKAVACKRLAIDGTYHSVPDLARLLGDPQLASWARIALEAIPGPEADEALRTAAGELQGLLLTGAINSIAVRRDPRAVETLVPRLGDADPEVAAAAAVALGHIGTPQAAAALRKSLTLDPAPVRSAVALGCVLCAEARYAGGDSPAAIEIYDEVRAADVPRQRVLEATRGAILARKSAGIPLLVEQLRSPDEARMRLALAVAREFPGPEVDVALSEELADAAPERAALIVQAMADRPETVVRPALLEAAQSGSTPVRLAALDALGRVGDVNSLPALLEAAGESDAEIARAARSALARVPGADIDARIVELLPAAQGSRYPLLIELVGMRRIRHTPALIEALDHSDPAVRAAALEALGATIAPPELSLLVKHVVSPAHGGDRAAAERALRAAAVRMPDPEACAAELVAALDLAPSTEAQRALLETLAAVGGARALAALGTAAAGGDPQLQDVASRALGEWMSDDAAPVLLDLARGAPDDRIRSRALRGYLRIARQFDLPVERRVAMCRDAYGAARQTSERRLVLDVLQRYATPESLQAALEAMRTADVKDDATKTALIVAQKLAAQGVDVRAPLAQAGIEPVALSIVKAEYGAGAQVRDVTAALRQHAGTLPLILLPGSYNAVLGGDPAPGVVKHLRVEYEIDGRRGEARFDENAVLLLPTPK